MSAFGGISKGDDGGKQKKMVHNEAANQLTDQLEDDSAADPNLKIWFGHALGVRQDDLTEFLQEVAELNMLDPNDSAAYSNHMIDAR